MAWLENLKALKKMSGMRNKDIAEASGVPEPTLEKIFSGKTVNPGINTIQSITHAMGYTLDDIDDNSPAGALTEEELDLITTFRRLDPYGRVAVNSIAGCERTRCDDTTDTQVIPLRLSLQSVSAGYGIYLGPEEFDTISVESTPQTRRAGFAVPVRGDSMEPLYHDGDVLLVDPDTDVELGEVGVYTLDGEGYVKKRGEAQLLPLNPAYPPVPLTDDVRCNGKVIGAIRL